MSARWSIGLLGGTGPQGRGLALRWSLAGYRCAIGSRDEAKAAAAAAELATMVSERVGASPKGMSNERAARESDVVVLTVPYAAQAETLASVARHLPGKLLIDVAVPLTPPRVSVACPPAAGSAAAEARDQLGDGVRVAAAFQNVAASKLLDPDAAVDCDVLVCSDDRDAAAVVVHLAEAAGMTAYDAGPLANAQVVDGLTAVLIGLNRRYGSRSAGVRITGLPSRAARAP